MCARSSIRSCECRGVHVEISLRSKRSARRDLTKVSVLSFPPRLKKGVFDTALSQDNWPMSSRVISCLSYPARGHWDYNHINYHVRLLPEFWGCKLRLSLATSPAYKEFNLTFFKPTLPAGPFPTPQGMRERLAMVSKLQSCDV